MRLYTFDHCEYYESSDFFDQERGSEDLEVYVGTIVREFTKRRLFREVLEAYSQRTHLTGYILLSAHGLETDGSESKWIFFDGKREHIMQNWINKMDGQALALLLDCCNTQDYTIVSEQSVIIHPKDPIGILDLYRGGHLRMYVPGEGYLDTHYQLRKTIDMLK
ncbi:MAG TPA: hypothetical protein VJB08_01130 [Candidatus Nanoarchaeia archaeon]|nr:hypothetical protein [Candidatus Nanoarchaeia archaeon]